MKSEILFRLSLLSLVYGALRTHHAQSNSKGKEIVRNDQVEPTFAFRLTKELTQYFGCIELCSRLGGKLAEIKQDKHHLVSVVRDAAATENEDKFWIARTEIDGVPQPAMVSFKEDLMVHPADKAFRPCLCQITKEPANFPQNMNSPSSSSVMKQKPAPTKPNVDRSSAFSSTYTPGYERPVRQQLILRTTNGKYAYRECYERCRRIGCVFFKYSGGNPEIIEALRAISGIPGNFWTRLDESSRNVVLEARHGHLSVVQQDHGRSHRCLCQSLEA